MTTHYADFSAKASTAVTAYPVSYSGSGLFNMSPAALDLMDYLPSYFFLGENNRKVVEVIAALLNEYGNNIDEVKDQFFVETATWGLKFWEQLVGCPVDEASTDWATRRQCILNKLRDCSSEECFIEGIEGIINGAALVLDLPPNTNPYQISLELRSNELVYAGPSSAPTAIESGAGPLDGYYTYRVTYEFNPVEIPSYFTLFPYGNTSGIFGSTQPIGQRQFLSVTGSGGFSLALAGISSEAGPFTETSTAADIVAGLNTILAAKYGADACSTPYENNEAQDGVILVFDGTTSIGISLPLLQVTNTSGTLSGSVVVTGDPEFVQPEISGETSSGAYPTRTNEIQVVSQESSSITGGTFTLSYSSVWDELLPPLFDTTVPLPYNATASQIRVALEDLNNIYPNSIRVYGGPLPLSPIAVEFVGINSGFAQSLLVVDNSSLIGSTLEASRLQAGNTTYSGSESNTILVSNKSVLLQGVPKSPDGAVRRNIYRKKTEAPYNEWRYIGSIEDNYTTFFIDDVADEDISEVQKLFTFGNGTFRLRFDSQDTVVLNEDASAGVVEAALDTLVSATYPDVSVSVTGTSAKYADGGLTITFDGGDVAGKDVPQMELVDTSGVTGYVVTTGPQILSEQNTAFTFTLQRLLDYIYATKPAHIRIRELRNSAFRASINSAGDPV